MMSAWIRLPSVPGIAVLVSGTTVVSAATRGTGVGVGLAAAEPLAAGLALAPLATAGAPGLALAEAGALAAGLAALAAGATLGATGELDGAALPPQAASRKLRTTGVAANG